jgi:hypothetical protein
MPPGSLIHDDPADFAWSIELVRSERVQVGVLVTDVQELGDAFIALNRAAGGQAGKALPGSGGVFDRSSVEPPGGEMSACDAR